MIIDKIFIKYLRSNIKVLFFNLDPEILETGGIPKRTFLVRLEGGKELFK